MADESAPLAIFPAVDLSYSPSFHSAELGLDMLDDEFKKQRARTVRELADMATDPFIKGRLLDLASRYDGGDPKAPTPRTALNLQFESRGTGSER